jgi:hypothetical protein
MKPVTKLTFFPGGMSEDKQMAQLNCLDLDYLKSCIGEY